MSQPKWNENETVLAKAVHTPDRDPGPLEGAMAGSWSLGIVEQSQGKRCCGLQRDGSRGCEGGDCGGKCLWRKARQPWTQGDTAESRVGVEPSPWPLYPYVSASAAERERGWPVKCLMH